MADPSDGKKLQLQFLAVGRQDSLVMANVKEMKAALDKQEIKHVYFEMEGGHNWSVWRPILYHEFLPKFFKEGAE